MKNNNSKVKAIIAGIGSYNDLGLIRSCGEAGISSIYLIEGSQLIVPIYRSRYVDSFSFMDFTVESIRKKIWELTPNDDIYYIVFPASDSAVLVFDILASKLELPKNVYVSHANGNMRNIMNKSVMAQMALESNLEIPQTIACKLDSKNIDIQLRFPIIIKPVCSTDGEKSDIAVALTNNEFQNIFQKLKDKGYKEILIQEYIHTQTSREIGITGISYPDGNVEVYGYIDKIRNKNKVNNYGIYHPNINVQCLDSLKSYIRLTGYIGIFDTDFIEDRGKWYFIECNFRNGAYGYCTTKAGFNMPSRFAKRIIGNIERLKPLGSMRDITFMEERTDIFNVLDHSISWRKWLKEFYTIDTFLWWSWNDPKPLLRIPYFIKRYFR